MAIIQETFIIKTRANYFVEHTLGKLVISECHTMAMVFSDKSTAIKFSQMLRKNYQLDCAVEPNFKNN